MGLEVWKWACECGHGPESILPPVSYPPSSSVNFNASRPLEAEESTIVTSVRTMFTNSAGGSLFGLVTMALGPKFNFIAVFLYRYVLSYVVSL